MIAAYGAPPAPESPRTNQMLEELQRRAAVVQAPAASLPIPMRIPCPDCGELHIDEGEFAIKPHHTHACQACGAVWRPAVVTTVGVRFLPGFKNEAPNGSR